MSDSKFNLNVDEISGQNYSRETMKQEWECHVFFANWCKPCQRIKPKWIEEIKPLMEIQGIRVLEQNQDQTTSKETMQKFERTTIPTIVITKDTEVVFSGGSEGFDRSKIEMVLNGNVVDEDEDF